MTRTPILLATALLLSGCGLHPLYSGGASGPVAQTMQTVSVGPIPGKAGWLVHNALEDRLGHGSGGQYRLEVALDDQITGFGVRADNAVTRERRTLRARYKLFAADAPADAKPLVDATAASDVGIDVVSSEYATIAAEQTALERLSSDLADRIIARIAIFARNKSKNGS